MILYPQGAEAPKDKRQEPQKGRPKMTKLANITETAEAITAEAIAYVWEEYDAPRKRVKRVRPVEHAFTVSIQKTTKDAAPLAFVVEYFPQMVGRPDIEQEYRPGYDQHIRAYGGRFYTPARFSRHPTHTGTYIDPRGELKRSVESISDIAPYDIAELIEKASRNEYRADKWHYYAHSTAEYIDDRARSACADLLVISGELWKECDEPAYIYHAPDRWRGITLPAYITVSDDRTSWGYRNCIGALDRIAMAFYHDGAERHAFIDVKRPDLVTIDSTARDLAADRDRQQRYTDDAADKVKRLEEQLKEAREDLDKERESLAKRTARLDTYQRAPLDYWRERIGDASESRFLHIQRKAAAAARIISSKEA